MLGQFERYVGRLTLLCGSVVVLWIGASLLAEAWKNDEHA
jgi:hypothetical protein